MTTFSCSIVLRSRSRPVLPFVPLNADYAGTAGDVHLLSSTRILRYNPGRGRVFSIIPQGNTAVPDLSQVFGTDEDLSIHARLTRCLAAVMNSPSLVCVEQLEPVRFVHVSAKDVELGLYAVSTDSFDLLTLTTGTHESILYDLRPHPCRPILQKLRSVDLSSITFHPQRMVARWNRLTQERKDRMLKFTALADSLVDCR